MMLSKWHLLKTGGYNWIMGAMSTLAVVGGALGGLLEAAPDNFGHTQIQLTQP